jgi:hypothetical protein
MGFHENDIEFHEVSYKEYKSQNPETWALTPETFSF